MTRKIPLQVNLDGFFSSFSSISKINSGSSGRQSGLLISVFNRMTVREKNKRDIEAGPGAGRGEENLFFPVHNCSHILELLTVDLKFSVC
jgi:hypothetical protein